MTIVSTTNASTVTLTNIYDSVLVASGASINGSSYGILTTNTAAYDTIQILGSVVAPTYGVKLAGGGSSGNEDTHVFVAEGAYVAGADGAGIMVNTNGNEIDNAGTISGSVNGIRLYNCVATHIHNSGTIDGGSYAIQINGVSGSQNLNLDNSGQMFGRLALNGVVQIVNSGHITADYNTIDDYAATSTDTLTVINSGTIANTDLSGAAINVAGSGGAVATVHNHAAGTIVGAVVLDNGDDIVANQGTIDGAVNLGAGNDTYRGHGTVTGSVTLGDGADSFHGGSAGMVDGGVSGGAGDDSFFLRGAGLDVDGGTGTDTLTTWAEPGSVAGFENVNLKGHSDLDITLADDGTATSVSGNRGSNDIAAGDGNDTLMGHRGADLLDGGAGNDDLRGGRGNDELQGGTGKDALRGGLGHDVFVFVAAADSTRAPSGRDTIFNFAHHQDHVDLSDIIDGSFHWRGHHGFSGHHAEVRYATHHGNAIAQIDVNGDGSADMAIKLAGTGHLTAHDFFL